jgi:hypothetical protein
MLAFIIRLVGYALLLGVASRFAQQQWTAAGLDNVASLQPAHDASVTLLLFAPLAFALVGFGALRDTCVFVACFLAGAAVTAPFVLARLAGV